MMIDAPCEYGREERRQRQRRVGVLIALLSAFIGAMVWMRMERPVLRGELIGEAPLLPEMRIDVNTADAAELCLLPGIGPRLAERIVEDRLAGGTFASIDELIRVRGIGPTTIERVRPFVIVQEPVLAGVSADD